MAVRDLIGILALQGDFAEHQQILRKFGVEPVLVKLPPELERVDRLIIPGGESTTIGKLLVHYTLLQPLRARIKKGMPVWGTCAGAILLATRVTDGLQGQPRISLMDITARRNAFGRQLDSFDAKISMPTISKKQIRVLFIRAPVFEKPGKDVKVFARLPDGRIVAARQSNMLITAFHPELAGAADIHRYFLAM